jgi:hypothetical protein
MTTRQVGMRAASVTMILPGTWANIPLDDPRVSDGIIAALVKRQVGRDDRLARTRREAKEQLTDVVDRARTGGAFQVALSLEILPGVPFPAAMFLSYQDWAAPHPTVDASAACLGEMLPGAEILELESGCAARVWRQVDIRPGEETVPDTKLEYLLPTPAGDKLLRILADAPIDCDPEVIVALFDAMVDSIRWVDPPQGEARRGVA